MDVNLTLRVNLQRGIQKDIRTLISVNQRVQGDTNQRAMYTGPAWNRDAGADWDIWLGEKEKALIRRLNPREYWNGRWIETEEKIHWAVWDRIGGLYQYDGISRDTSPWRWHFICMAGRVGYPDQSNVLEILSYYNNIQSGVGGWAEVSLIPVMDNYDSINAIDNPGWLPQVYAGSYLTPKGHFCMPMFSPLGRRHPLPNDITGCYVPTEYLVPK